jgi:hypothetical protein
LRIAFRQKGIRQKIFGSDLHLSAKKITGRPVIQWAAIAAAREKNRDFTESYLMEYIFNQAWI